MVLVALVTCCGSPHVSNEHPGRLLASETLGVL